MIFDDVLRALGEFGPYQKRLYLAICVPMAFHAMQSMSTVFTMFIPNYRCAIPGLDNDTYAVQNQHHEAMIALYIPRTSEGYFPCELYDIYSLVTNISELVTNAAMDDVRNHLAELTTSSDLANNSRRPERTKCHRWVYDKSVFDDTIIAEANLVCSKSIYRAHVTTAYFAGGLCALSLLGPLADRYGRKKSSYILLICMLISSLMLMWLPDIHVYIAFKFLHGFSSGAFFNMAFVYVMEFIGPSERGTWGLFTNNFWGVGVVIQSAIAYGIRSWRHLQLAFALPIFISIAYWWTLPESARWLVVKGHKTHGHAVLKVMARGNGADLDLSIIHTDALEERSKPQEERTRNTLIQFLKPFRNKTLAIRTLVVFWNWFVVSMLFYGIALNVPNLGGDLYINSTVSAIVEIVGYTLSIPLTNRLGRKRAHVIIMCTGGACLLSAILPEVLGNGSDRWIMTAMYMIGKLVSSAAFATIFVFTSELFPTVIRSTVMSTSANIASAGAIVAPYVVELATVLDGNLATVTPMLVFGAVTLSGGLMSLVLPETAGTNLPDHIQDMVQDERDSRQGPVQACNI